MASDAELIERSLTEPEAFEEVFERHVDVVLAFARRRVGWTAGEDLAAQTFLVAFRTRERFDPAFASARPWLLGIATNLVRHHLRDERVRLAALGRVGREPPEDSIPDVERLDAERVGPALAAALRELSEADRATFVLIVAGDLTYEEAARALGVPIGTVRSRVHRARLRLRERLERFAGTNGWKDEDPEDPWTSSS